MNEALREIMLPAFEESDRTMSATDLVAIDAAAQARHLNSQQNADAPADLLSFALSVGCSIWLGEPQAENLKWPVADPLSHAFAYNLLQQMSRASGRARPFSSMAELCYQLAAESVGDTSDVSRASFYAGLAWGQAASDRHQDRADELQLHLSAIEKARSAAQQSRKLTFERQARAKELALLDLATEMIGANPFTSDKDIQDLYRDRHGLPENTSNAEAKSISRLRRQGLIPERRAKTGLQKT